MDALRVAHIKGACDVDLWRNTSAYAMYLVQVRPDGQIARVILENFSPTAGVGERLKKCAYTYEFAPFSGQQPLTTRIPVVYGYSSGPGLITK